MKGASNKFPSADEGEEEDGEEEEAHRTLGISVFVNFISCSSDAKGTGERASAWSVTPFLFKDAGIFT